MADGDLERITILLQARDKDLSRSIDQMNRKIAGFTRTSTRNTAQMQQQVESHFQRMGQSVASFGRNFVSGLAVGAATAALGVFTTNLRRTVTSMAEVGDEARRAGLDVEEFQQWAYVAQQNRVALDSLVDGFKELNIRADEFVATGGGGGAESFRRLGYDAMSLADALEDPSELLLEIFNRLQRFDRAAQIRIADEVFGGTGGERFVQLIEQGERGLRATMERAREVGAVLDSEMIDRAAEIDRKFNEIAEVIENRLKNAVIGWSLIVQDVVDLMTTDDAERSAAELQARYSSLAGEARSLQAMMEILRDAASGLGDPAMMARFDQIAYSVDSATDAFNDGAIGAEGFGDILESIVTEAENALRAANGIDDVDLSNATIVVGGLRDMLAQLQTQAANTAAAVAAATITPVRQVESFWDTEEGRFSLNRLAPSRSPRPRAAPTEGSPAYGGVSGGSAGGGGGAEGYAAAVEDIRARTRELNLEAAALAEAASQNIGYGDAVEYARTRAQLMNDALAEGRTITPELQAEIDGLAAAYVAAGQSAEDAAAQVDELQQAAADGASAMTDLFTGLVQGGDEASSAIERLRQQLLQISVSRIMQALSGSGGGFGRFFSLIGMGLGGKRAAGGPVRAGVAYRVNENTANSEIKVESRSGGILNVAQAKDALRGSGGSAGTSVVVQNFGNDKATAATSRGPDGRELIRIVVAEEMARGRFDKSMARYSKPKGLVR